MYVMGYRQTKGRAFSIAARNIAVMFFQIRTTVEDVGKSAKKDSIAAMEDVLTLFTMCITVESVTRSVRMVLNVSMDIVGMPECFFKVRFGVMYLTLVTNNFYEYKFIYVS